MNIDDLARIMGKTRRQVEEMLKRGNMIELNLSERKSSRSDEDDFRVRE